MDQLLSLQSENNSLRETISDVKAERTAIDQMYIASMKNEVQLRKHIVLLQEEVQELSANMELLQTFNEKLEKEIAGLKAPVIDDVN